MGTTGLNQMQRIVAFDDPGLSVEEDVTLGAGGDDAGDQPAVIEFDGKAVAIEFPAAGQHGFALRKAASDRGHRRPVPRPALHHRGSRSAAVRLRLRRQPSGHARATRDRRCPSPARGPDALREAARQLRPTAGTSFGVAAASGKRKPRLRSISPVSRSAPRRPDRPQTRQEIDVGRDADDAVVGRRAAHARQRPSRCSSQTISLAIIGS